MDNDVFNMSLRKFLKKVGVTTQREIESAVRAALAGGTLRGDETLSVRATIVIDGVGKDIVIPGDIDLV